MQKRREKELLEPNDDIQPSQAQDDVLALASVHGDQARTIAASQVADQLLQAPMLPDALLAADQLLKRWEQ